ncbi:MAG TPA: 4Fe-4S ferredoxin, partial [Pirellulaceae bacterium]|nr:4Fe-4S ferredoxin [Pirellulaceae bacterium]
MRLDIFLPALRKPKPGQPLRVLPLTELAQRVLPASWFSNPATKQRGLVRRALRWLGPTWLSSPVRRLSQALCFALFLWLFFFVCYPYTAQPGKIWPGWQPQAIAEDGTITLSRAEPADLPPRRGQTIYSDAGPLAVATATSSELTLHPAAGFPPEKLEEMRFALGGPWTLSEQPPGAWPSHYTDSLRGKELIHAESILIIDPLVAISTAIASRTWVWSL